MQGGARDDVEGGTRDDVEEGDRMTCKEGDRMTRRRGLLFRQVAENEWMVKFGKIFDKNLASLKMFGI